MSEIKGFIGAVDISCDRLFLSFVVKNDHTSEKPVQYKDYSLASNHIQRIAVSSHHHPKVNIRCTRFLGADQRKTVRTGCRDSIVVDDELCSYGIKAVFPRGQRSVLVGLKQCSQGDKAVLLWGQSSVPKGTK